MKDSFAREGKRVCEGVVDTQQLGEELGAALEAGDLVILDGPLGAGKTTFTQGIARGMQVKGRVTSPTFVIARQHASTVGGPALVHVDAYRLGDDPLGELDALDLDTELEDAVVVAEWGGGLMEQLGARHILVQLDRETLAETEGRIVSWRVVEGM
ncbi:tRNA (adenosine(37)-N6)-threonylcarbamoyltransferase complex ATPase subunit type 1 TsaE [Corynebacterium coyleae]|uniref:tRNA threonylcarbamoyladenosine biosynthesis protein TsaE n=1 Tax=Corynebacterium coyleae TaxID=53374 RepID=A0AAP6XL06_9CORY|nr:tRNA (adenosine(37)-N6)-threonylcarbamoyltransferase complex ATPase subunit type 1 TsaE [Corynebacterium coyleae]MDK8240509.1 tRNA (adenosine(37)-N6)-threonylcarbamoyltransferase complex ATPase subunit type 1 TsaE [Corynebacterium coyleae]NJJ03253.1 tRNA (adenosine(37)-N6)-threonylcarbamoyltransferase complex ATPase subunit type 1 TsaE [Corynebacterium coyleae]PLA28249.1 tRNA (adenosine(37)-N6)-threonylcarbamoyltransferase complex ATPase subunit type 1 TsaE [Corynebacterium coyleae]